MYKSIIPGLVTFETTLNRIPGSFLFRDLNYYPKSTSRARFHYDIDVGNVAIPQKYDFRHSYYRFTDGIWYYQRRLPGGVSLKFLYDDNSKRFVFNKSYLAVPVELGGILPIGKHITDIITLDLFQKDIFIMRGLAYCLKNIVVAAIAPSFNGKTTLLGEVLRQGGLYISEDILVIEPDRKTVYPTSSIAKNFGRHINARVDQQARNHLLSQPQKVDRLIFYFNQQNNSSRTIRPRFDDYWQLSSLLAHNNNFIKSYGFVNHLAQLTNAERIKQFKWFEEEGEYMALENFNYEPIVKSGINANRDHWDGLGEKYSNVWKSPAKQALSNAELGFVSKHLIGTRVKNVLDIGVGNGRIIDELLKTPRLKRYEGLILRKIWLRLLAKSFLKK